MSALSKTISDNDIIELFFSRDESAITETDQKYGKLLYSIAYGILHDGSDCEECQNDTYLAAWRTIPPTRPRSFRAFLVQLLRRIAINRYNERAQKSRVPSELTSSLDELSEIIPSKTTVESELANAELSEIINKFITRLDRRQRYIFISRFYMAQTLETIAGELNISVTKVHRELKKMKQMLRDLLERSGIEL